MKLYLVLAALIALAAATNGPAASYYTADGAGNNIRHPGWGAYATFKPRSCPSNFPANGDLLTPNQRSISNLLADEPVSIKNDNGINMFESFFGQFINHDKEFTRNANAAEAFIRIPLLDGAADKLYSATATNNEIHVSLAEDVKGRLTPRGPLETQSVNYATSWLDLSDLYGNNATQLALMRSGVGGALKSSSYSVQLIPGAPSVTFTNMLPSQAITGLPIQTALTLSPAAIVTAGDERVNENVGLSLVTTVFFREHNKNAAALKAANPTWDDERLFQAARKLTVAAYQRAIYEEYLPAILQPSQLRALRYRGYKRTVDGATTLEFALGAFRYGHSTIAQWTLLNATDCPYNLFIPAGVFGPRPVITSQLPSAGQQGGPLGFPQLLAFAGADNILRGLLRNKANKVDIKVADSLRNIVFVGSNGRGVDILNSDISRGRMLGLASYHSMRKRFFNAPGVPEGYNNVYEAPGCDCEDDDDDDHHGDDDRRRQAAEPDPLACFLEVTSDADLAAKLRTTYGKVSKIEGIVGLLAEDHEEGAYLPRTIANIIAAEYKRVRDGDRFFYENEGVLSRNEMNFVKTRTLAAMVRDAFPGIAVPDDIFHAPDNLVCNA